MSDEPGSRIQSIIGHTPKELVALERKAAMFDWIASQDRLSILHMETSGCTILTRGLEQFTGATVADAVRVGMKAQPVKP